MEEARAPFDNVTCLGPEGPPGDEDEERLDQDRLDQIWEVMAQDWLFYYDPQDLVDHVAFHDLEFSPSLAEIEEVQDRHKSK